MNQTTKHYILADTRTLRIHEYIIIFISQYYNINCGIMRIVYYVRANYYYSCEITCFKL